MTSFLAATSMTSVRSLLGPPVLRSWKSRYTSSMSKGMYCSASLLIYSASSSSSMTSRFTFLTMTEYPDMEMPTLVFLILRLLKRVAIIFPTSSGSCRTPSSTDPSGIAALPRATTMYPLPVFCSLQTLTAEEPISTPVTSCSFFAIRGLFL